MLRPYGVDMYFPDREKLRLACVCERVIAGKLHTDGRRYLPTVVLRPVPSPATETSDDLMIGVVDRHHRLPPDAVGRTGAAQLVAALSTLRMQTPPFRRGFVPEALWQPGAVSLAPRIFGQVKHIFTWEVEQGALPYTALYTELLLDVGHGSIGVRTSLTAADLAAAIGAERLAPGDWIVLDRSRIDLLGMSG
jgi:hypothetical protein